MNIQLQIYVLACFDLQQVKTSVTQKKCFSVNKIFEPLHSIGRGFMLQDDGLWKIILIC